MTKKLEAEIRQATRDTDKAPKSAQWIRIDDGHRTIFVRR